MFDKAAGLLPAFLDAAAELVRRGADGITTTCGFLSLYQREIAAHVGVPVATAPVALEVVEAADWVLLFWERPWRNE